MPSRSSFTSKSHLVAVRKCIPGAWRKSPTPSPHLAEEKSKCPQTAEEATSKDTGNQLFFFLIQAIKSSSSSGHVSKAFAIFSVLRRYSPPPFLLLRPVSFLLCGCTKEGAVLPGKQLHAQIICRGLLDHPCLMPKLTSFYAGLDFLVEALAIVEGSINMLTLPWNLLIWAYSRNALWQDVIFTYRRMVELRVGVDKFTYPSVLRACGEMNELGIGREIHRITYERGLKWDLYAWNALLGMYAKCGALDAARNLFDRMDERDVVTWNSMISGYVSNGMWEEAFELLQLMPETSRVNAVTWNTIAAGNLHIGNHVEVIQLISLMGNAESGINSVTIVIGLAACSRVENIKLGKEIHGMAVRLHYDAMEDVNNSLITMYSRSKVTNYAYILFRISKFRSLVTWNAMLAGFVCTEQALEASLLFTEMIGFGVHPNKVSILTMLSLCACFTNLRHGRELHSYICKKGFDGCKVLQNSLVDMYSKSGMISTAHRVFDRMSFHDPISYTSLIFGYGMQGMGVVSLKLFNEMVGLGIEPDHVTMVAILSACSHSDLLIQGQMLFDKMVPVFGIVPRVEHFSCMVHLYSRAGLLKKAEEVIDKMPQQPSAAMLATLVEACRIHGSVEMGDRAAKKLLGMRLSIPSHYILVANFYASFRRSQELDMVRSLMRDIGSRIAPCHSWLNLGSDQFPVQLEAYGSQCDDGTLMLLGGLSDHASNVGYACDEELKFTEAIGG